MAADMQATYGSLRRKSSKLIPVRYGKSEYIVGLTGSILSGQIMLDWIRKGRKPDQFPAIQQTDDWCRVILGEVGTGKVWYYDRIPIPIPILDEFGAWGSAEELALGVLAMHGTAYQAVEVAIKFNTDCGFGVEEYPLIS